MTFDQLENQIDELATDKKNELLFLIVCHMYREVDELNPDKEWDSDTLPRIAEELNQYDLVPK